jgi:hypothetical protein
MHTQDKIKRFRQEMRDKLREWIPHNESLVEKELSIFDRVMGRREFLQTISVATAYTLFYQGCSDLPPSQWQIAQASALSDDEILSVTKTSKLVVDSDVLDSVVEYAPLQALASSDATDVQKSSMLESFNPHLMTVTSTDALQSSGLKLLTKNYGTAEIVHLTKESQSSNYFLKIYENLLNTSQNSLFKTAIELTSTQSITFDKLVSSNGTYHNHVANGLIYSQKMIAVSNSDNTTNPDIRVYYQSNASKLLEPSVEYEEDTSWEYLNIIDHFNYAESYSFTSYSIVDLDNYSDGVGNRFIYGTIRFDDLYSYGFVIAYASLGATKPRVSFFAPKFLSVHASTISDMQSTFNSLGIDTDGVLLKDFTIFQHQKFLPFSSLVTTQGSLSDSVLFSFESFDVENMQIHKINEKYNLNLLTETYNSTIKRYMISVDITGGGVTYLLDTYENRPSMYVANDILHFTFNTSDIQLGDIYRDIYKSDDIGYEVALLEMQTSYIRGVVNNTDEYHIILASSYFDSMGMGIAQKSIKLDSVTYRVNQLLKSKVSFDDTFYEEHSYKTLWFNDTVDSLVSKSLHESVVKNGGKYDFYATQNQQGILKGYFVIKIQENDFLLNFNEQGQNPEPTAEQLYNYQDFDDIYTQIKENKTLFFPPIPIATGVKSLFVNRSVGQEEEVLYTAIRDKKVESSSQTLVENEDETLLSYSYSTYDNLSGVWSTQELSQNLTEQESKSHLFKQPRHIVHMYANSIYDYPSQVEENIYIEVRFTKAVVVTNLTFIDTPKTYRAKRDTSLFLKPDRKGKITLEIQSGVTRQEIFNGTSMLYRLLDENDLTLDQDKPIATINSSSTSSTNFMHCNISFKLLQRVSTEHANHFQEGVLQSEVTDVKTAHTIFNEYAKDDEKDNISKVTDMYTKLAASATVASEMNFVSLANSTIYYPLKTISPMLFLYNDVMLEGVSLDKSKFSKWMHHVVSTIKHAIHKGVKELSKKIKSALEKLLPKIEDLLSNSSISLDGVLSVLMSIVDKIVSFANHIYIAYFEPFWDFIKGFFDFKSAFIVGQEFKTLFHEQMLEDTSNPHNAYSIVKDETLRLQNEVDTFIANVKKDIDKTIDDKFDTHPTNTDENTKKKHDSSSIQKNSVKYHHGMNTMFKVYKKVVNPQAPDEPMDNSLFTCNANFGVEQLLSCIMNKEKEDIAKTIIQMSNDNNKVLHNIANNGAVGDEKQNIATLLKDSVNCVIDEVDILTDGIVQVPLAFLNGSSSVDLLEKELDALMKDVFEVIGIIFFNDPEKFKTFDDVGYFLLGYITFFQLSILDPHTETTLDATATNINLIKYIKDGDFREDFKSVVADAKSTKLSDVIAFCDIIDSVLFVAITVGDFFVDSLSISKFNLIQRILKYLIIFRIPARVPKLIRHIEYSNTEDDTKAALVLFATMADIFHIATLIIEIFKIKNFSYDDIKNGVEAGGVYGGLATLHAVLFFFETYLELAAVFDLGEGSDEKKELEQIKKTLEFVASLPSGLLDLLSGNSEEENLMSGVRALKYFAYIILTLCYGTIGVITIEHLRKNSQ